MANWNGKTLEYLEDKVIRAEAKYVKDQDDLTNANAKYWSRDRGMIEYWPEARTKYWDEDEALAESLIRIKRLKALILEIKEQDNDD